MPRRPFRFRTVRAQLITTTMLVFVLLFGTLCLIFDLGSRQALMNSVDADLERRGLDLAHVVGRHRDGPGHRPNRKLDPQWIAPQVIPIVPEPGQPSADALAYDYAAFQKAARGEKVFSTCLVDSEPRRVFSAPVRSHGKVVEVIQVSSSLESALSALDSQRAALLRFVIPFGLVLGAAGSLFVVYRLLKPLRYLTLEAERIGREGFGERLAPRGDDEFAVLALTLNTMLKGLEDVYSLEKETNRRLEETIEQQRRFTSDASHELKTPLAVLMAYLGLLRTSDATVAEEMFAIGEMEEAASRMRSLIQDLLLLARTDAGPLDKTPVPVGEILDRAVRATPHGSERTSLAVVSSPKVVCAPKDLMRVFINLIDNAIKYSGSSRPIELEVREGEGTVDVVIRDFGQGIPAVHLPHLFERFYRTDESRTSETGGTGLGLAICEQIVKSHEGEIGVESELGRGTVFTVRLPVYRAVA